MTTAIRKHLRDFIAIAVLVVVALVASYIIVQQQRLRIPILESKPFELKAEFQTAQAVVPGQGQTIRVAGVRVGDVENVQLEHGVGVVTFAIDRSYLPIYKNATILMRPATGLKDMFFELDPGTKSAGEIPDGGTVPVSNTAPDVNLDEILSALDGDTQAYLRLLLIGAGQGLKGQSQNLGKVLGSLGPLNSDLDKLNSLVSQRDKQLADLVHNFNVLTKELGDHKGDITSFVQSSNDALSVIAAQDPDVQRATADLPGTLNAAEHTFRQVDAMSKQLGPAFAALSQRTGCRNDGTDTKFACNLDEMNSSLQSLATQATPELKNQIRPFVRTARPVIPPLNTAAQRYSKATPRLTVVGHMINRLGNMAAYNPHGAQGCPGGSCSGQQPARDEGYLYWAAWLSHVGNTVFQNGDGTGLYRRIYFTASCGNVANILSETPLAAIASPFGAVLETACP